MDRPLLHFTGFFLIALGGAAFLAHASFDGISPQDLLSGTFFVQSITEEEILARYRNAPASPHGKIKILIVPGHDSLSWGTEFKGLREAHLNSQLAKYLTDLFSKDGSFLVFTTQNIDGYTPWFSNYIRTETDNIKAFREGHMKTMRLYVEKGLIHERQEVFHNDAPGNAVTQLYGINKWANENNMDLVIHVHFNDHPGRKSDHPGKYSGFSIYVPEKQFSNANVSRQIAEEVMTQLSTYFPISNMPREREGIVEDQELIAIGAFNSLDAAALFMEYEYIYEGQLHNEDITPLLLSLYAKETYRGVKNYFEGNDKKSEMLYVPLKENRDLKRGLKYNTDVFQLQKALASLDLFPPDGFSKHECVLSGIFGPCTEKAVISFQKKYDIAPAEGFVGEKTRNKLREILSRSENLRIKTVPDLVQ